MKFKFLPLLVALMLCFGFSAQAASYVNGVDANYPPFAFVDEKGKVTGFDVESMNWIANKMGFTVKHQPMDWDGIVPSLLAKKIDMVCSGMSISPERLKKVTFSEPYWSIRKVLITKKDSKLTAQEILNGKLKLGVQRGTNEAEFLQAEKDKKKHSYELRFYDSSPLAVEDLLNGRIDAVALDSAPAEDAIKKGKAVKEVGIFNEEDKFGVAMRNEDAALHKLINEGYKHLMADPFWKELQDKFLNN